MLSSTVLKTIRRIYIPNSIFSYSQYCRKTIIEYQEKHKKKNKNYHFLHLKFGTAGVAAALISLHPKSDDIKENLPNKVSYLLIGGGAASVSAYRSIKARDPKAKILILSSQNEFPYMKPPVSQELFASENIDLLETMRFKQWNGKERSLYYEPGAFYTPISELDSRENGGISFIGSVTVKKIEFSKQIVHLSSGQSIAYDKCLLATDCDPKGFSLSHKIPDRVSHLNSIHDFKALAKQLSQSSSSSSSKKSITILGNGVLGSELAFSLGAQTKVTQIFEEKGNLRKLIPEYMSDWLTLMIQKEGVTIKAETKVVDAKKNRKGQVVLELSSGENHTTDHVILALGTECQSELSKASKLELDNNSGGVVVNEELEAKNNLWVAGNLANFYDNLLSLRRRSDDHDHAIRSGRLAGENMTGAKKKYNHQYMFWSDLGRENGFEAVGLIDSSLKTTSVWKTETDQKDSSPYKKGIIFYEKNGIVVGILLWNVYNKIKIAEKIIKEHRAFEDYCELAKLFDLYLIIKSENEE